MTRHWVEYGDAWAAGPLSFWVHVEVDGRPWNRAARFDPPLPGPVPGRGYARFYAEVEGFTFYFASLEEVRACIRVLGQRVLPTTVREASERRGGVGPNPHWLSRLPSRLLPWRRRQKIVRYLKEAYADFRRGRVS